MGRVAGWLAVASLSLVATAALAQHDLSVRGTLLDPTGAGIPGALIELDGPGDQAVIKTQTDASGHFLLQSMTTGQYTLVVPATTGFASRSIPLQLTNSVSGMSITLSPEAVQEQVKVGAEPGLSTDSAANSDTITTTGDQLRQLPIFDQDYVAALTPFLDPSAGSSGGATILVDGVEMKRAGVSASAIQEVRVNNDPYSAEFNRPGRGRIEIITKPGSPQFHGEFNLTDRDSVLNAKNYYALTKPPESRRIFEGHLAGPVGHGERSSFIASADYRQQDTAAVVNAVGPTGPIHENVSTPNRDSEYSMRVTHDFSPTHRLSLGYNYESSTSTNAGVGDITLAEAGFHQFDREDDAIINDRLILSPNLINQLQITLEKDEDNTRSTTNAQSIQVNGSFIGGGAQADVERSENTIHVSEVISWSHGKHYVRAGIQLPQFSRRAVDDRTNRLGTFNFASLANYSTATPYVFTVQQGAGRGLYWINEFGSYIQDQIKISSKLQISLGLRYDWQTFVPDNNNLAPRVSAAYALGQGKTVIRTGVGAFYDRTGGDFPSTVKLHNGVVLRSFQIQNPTYPFPVGEAAATLPTNLVRFDSHVRAPYAIQYSLGLERQLEKKLTISAAYRGQVKVKAFRSRDANAPLLPPDAQLGATYLRPDAQYGQIQQIESEGRTLLNALDLSLHGEVGRWFSGQAQYTLSRFVGNTGGIDQFPQDQYNPTAEWGRQNQDRLQRFNIIGTINPDHWLSLGVQTALYSGLPYTETTGDDYFHTGLGNARPAGVGRNTLQTGGVASLDLIYDHDFFLNKTKGSEGSAISAGISAFNVWNRTNYTNYIGTLSSPRFGQPTAALAARQLQLSVGYRF